MLYVKITAQNIPVTSLSENTTAFIQTAFNSAPLPSARTNHAFGLVRVGVMGKVELFAVYFEGNKRTFYPGEIINGTAFLKTNKELKLRGVRIEFHGQAKVRWSETSGSGKSHRHHSHSNQENFIDTAATLYGKGESKVPLLGSYSWERGC